MSVKKNIEIKANENIRPVANLSISQRKNHRE